MSEFTGYVKDKKLPVGGNPSLIEAYASIEDSGQLDTSMQWSKLLVSFSGSCPPKLSVSTAINPERA